jgi:quinol monooxygenase YgiN
MIYVIATTPMKPENKDDFIKGHKACTAETLKEKGCLAYEGMSA